jgi:P27 family predicted phage terminase small subunit
MAKYVIPEDIENDAAEYMTDVLSELENRGILEEVDSAALTMLARNYSMFIKASKQLEIDGLTVTSDRGNIVPHPLIKIAKDAQTQAMKVMLEFGLTAKSRTKLPKKDNEDTEPSPFEQFIKEGKEVR